MFNDVVLVLRVCFSTVCSCYVFVYCVFNVVCFKVVFFLVVCV